MSLITFAVIGKDNAPLYLRDFVDASTSFYEQGEASFDSNGDDEQDDPFGFFEQKRQLNQSSCLKNQVNNDRFSFAIDCIYVKYMCLSCIHVPSEPHQQFIIHSALDRFEELDDSNMVQQRQGLAKMWIGSLGIIDETKVYGKK